MNNKKRERRISLPSDVRNAWMVKNKCEELKLEKKRRWLDKLRAHEKLDFMNKKRELIDFQLSIQSSKTDESRQGCINHQITPVMSLLVKEDTFALQKKPFRTKSLSGSHIVPPLTKTTGENQLHRYARHSNSLGSLARNDYSTFRRFLPGRKMDDTTEATRNSLYDSAQAEEAAMSCQQKSVSKLFPPFYLQPLHKQKSKSLKDVSSAHLEKQPKLQISWYDLSHCRYLRSCKNT